MTRLCKICQEKHKAKGYCRRHYENFHTTGSPFGKSGRKSKYNEGQNLLKNTELVMEIK